MVLIHLLKLEIPPMIAKYIEVKLSVQQDVSLM